MLQKSLLEPEKTAKVFAHQRMQYSVCLNWILLKNGRVPE